MPSSIKFDLNLAEFGRQVQTLANATKRTVGEVVREQARLTVRDLIRSTPPHGKRPIMESWTFQRRKGEETIALDVNRLFVDAKSIRAIVSPTGRAHKGRNLKRQYLKQLLDQGRYERITEALFAMHVTPQRLRVIGALTKQAYRQEWTKFQKRGRIPKGVNSDIFVSRAETITAVIKEIAMKVGFAKAGWMKAAKKLELTRVPAWIARHTDAPGSFVDLTQDTATPSFTITNDVAYIAYLNAGNRLLNRALGNRQRAMEISIDHAIEHFLERWNEAA